MFKIISSVIHQCYSQWNNLLFPPVLSLPPPTQSRSGENHRNLVLVEILVKEGLCELEEDIRESFSRWMSKDFTELVGIFWS